MNKLVALEVVLDISKLVRTKEEALDNNKIKNEFFFRMCCLKFTWDGGVPPVDFSLLSIYNNNNKINKNICFSNE